MNFDEWHEQAGRAAYTAWNKTRIYKTVPFDDMNELDQQAWYDVARAVLGEGKIEVRPSAELAQAATREENERLVKIARERAKDAQIYRNEADELRSKLAGLRRACDQACSQRDKYMRRTAGWRETVEDLRKQVAQYQQSADEHVQKFDRKHEALVAVQRQIDAVREIVFDDAALSHEHRMQRLVEALGTDNVRACTGCTCKAKGGDQT